MKSSRIIFSCVRLHLQETEDHHHGMGNEKVHFTCLSTVETKPRSGFGGWENIGLDPTSFSTGEKKKKTRGYENPPT